MHCHNWVCGPDKQGISDKIQHHDADYVTNYSPGNIISDVSIPKDLQIVLSYVNEII